MTSKEKYEYAPMNSFSSTAPFFFLPFRARTAKKAWKFIFTIINDFFLLQWSQKLHIRKIPVLKVDTEIDDKIPFSPNHVTDYMSFVGFFVKPFDMMKKRLGYKTAASYMNLYLKFLTNLYKNAAKIYRFCMSTTLRPKYLKNNKFRAIHFFDPHLLCVPSIHVAIAAGSYFWFNQMFKTGILPEEEANRRLDEIKKQGIAIIESVLFVKQHSVNCVPMALYMISATMNKSFCTPITVSSLIDELFQNSDEISPDEKIQITEHFHYMYERAFLENKYSDDWETSIKHWLITHAQETGQKTPFSFTNDVLK